MTLEVVVSLAVILTNVGSALLMAAHSCINEEDGFLVLLHSAHTSRATWSSSPAGTDTAALSWCSKLSAITWGELGEDSVSVLCMVS